MLIRKDNLIRESDLNLSSLYPREQESYILFPKDVFTQQPYAPWNGTQAKNDYLAIMSGIFKINRHQRQVHGGKDVQPVRYYAAKAFKQR